jgi:hypothetical protein
MYDAIVIFRGVAMGGLEESGPRPPTVLQDQFCKSFKTEEKLGRCDLLMFHLWHKMYQISGFHIIIKRV